MAEHGGFSGGTTDVVVAGSGLIGRTCALALAGRGARVTLIGESRPGEASAAAAGMLAPSVERSEGEAHSFAIAARDRYPSYVAWLEEQTGLTVPLNRLGVLQVALSSRGERGLKRSIRLPSVWLTGQELLEFEPAFGHALGAVHSPDDGAVDNVALLAAVTAAISRTPSIRIEQNRVVRVTTGTTGARVILAHGQARDTGHVVIAAGAWTSQIEGLRFGSFVSPMRGQLMSWDGAASRHVVYGPRGYLVPRGESVIAGSTMEAVGFAPNTTPEGLERIRSIAEEILPGLPDRGSNPRAWAGLRPVTPDLLPLLGPDPENPRIIYATGHARNGVLMAPLTADCVAAMVFEASLNLALTPFLPTRF